MTFGRTINLILHCITFYLLTVYFIIIVKSNELTRVLPLKCPFCENVSEQVLHFCSVSHELMFPYFFVVVYCWYSADLRCLLLYVVYCRVVCDDSAVRQTATRVFARSSVWLLHSFCLCSLLLPSTCKKCADVEFLLMVAWILALSAETRLHVPRPDRASRKVWTPKGLHRRTAVVFQPGSYSHNSGKTTGLISVFTLSDTNRPASETIYMKLKVIWKTSGFSHRLTRFSCTQSPKGRDDGNKTRL